ncbi:MAG TPA: molybdopterin molybdotransferase MoeA [bacterium]|nr:molybdopterin molybdotransferase MoeA [bacterium]HMW32853.1 molybdopterin molybdotransferase MoeA [bacterium]HMW35012.1 molybdopterin molybdotransferase MoeA [bacterium]HMY36627.1 molybdopterin molybdotransferase MoeA [bacterium]HMZ04040.1 molybdopterin molybdotransferase MoeA [bacterium]
MISVDEALHIILSKAKPLAIRTVPFKDACGYALAENIVSREMIPPWDNSGVDGYAVIASDTSKTKQPCMLKVLDTVHAGDVSTKKLTAGTAIQIMTGAPVPRGTTAIVMVEHTRRVGQWVHIQKPAREGDHIRKAGSDIQKNQIVFSRDHIIRPYDLGVLASIGKSKIRIQTKPTIALLATGDELLSVEEKLKPGKIRASTHFALTALLQKAGYPVINLGIAHDTPKAIAAQIQKALKADVIITTGGVSMGEKDYVRQAVEKAGIKIHFWKVRQKPGKPMVFGSKGKKLFFGLPGNPVSSLVCFELYVTPAIARMASQPSPILRIPVRLDNPVSKKPGLRHFLRARLYIHDGQIKASLSGEQSSGVLSHMAYAQALLDIPENDGDKNKNDTVDAVVLDRDHLNQLIISIL